jgi:hypothetical protein
MAALAGPSTTKTAKRAQLQIYRQPVEALLRED